MKKLFSLFAAFLFVGSMWGEETQTLSTFAKIKNESPTASYSASTTGSSNVYSSGTTFTITSKESNVWTLVPSTSGSIYFSMNNGEGGFHLGSGSYDAGDATLTSSASYSNVTQVVVKGKTSKNGSVTISVKVGSTSFSLKSGSSDTFSGSTVATATFTNASPVSGTIEVTTTDGASNIAYFIESVTVTNTPPSTISFDSPAGGTLVIKDDGDQAITSGAEAEAGDLFTIIATPDATHKNPTITVTKDADDSDVTDDVLTDDILEMPDYSITVAASFTAKAVSAVTVTNPGHGTISVKDGDDAIGATVMEGKVLTVNVTGVGYTFTPKYKVGEGEWTTITNGGTITMPAAAITITADEAEIVTPYITPSVAAVNFGSVGKDASVDPIEFTISGKYLTEGNLSVSLDEGTAFEVSPASIPVNGTLNATTITVTPKASALAAVDNYYDIITISGGGAADVNVEVNLSVLPQYTAKWIVNGDTENPLKTVTDIEGADLVFPTNPTPADDCEGLVFVGWLTETLANASATEPSGLIKIMTGHTMPKNGITYYAVFAEEENTGSLEEKSVSTTMSDYVTAHSDIDISAGSDVYMYKSLTLDGNITLSTSGEDNCGSFWNTSNTDDTKQWRLYQNKSGNAIVTASNGYSLKSVTFTYVVTNTGALFDGGNEVESGSKQTISGVSKTYTVGNTASATNGQVRITAIAVEYEKDTRATVRSNYVTTCSDVPSDIKETVETSIKAVKVLRDGQIFILRGDKTFNAQGQLVK